MVSGVFFARVGFLSSAADPASACVSAQQILPAHESYWKKAASTVLGCLGCFAAPALA
jgi:hypothetical protein